MITYAKNFLLIYLLLKPFYIFGSGAVQVSDIFLLLSCILFLVAARTKRDVRESLILSLKSNRLLILFIIATILINVIYFLYYDQFKFLLSSIYFIFNLFAVSVFSGFYKDKNFLKRVGNIFKLDIFIQLIIFLSGVGRYYSLDRYMGTFNDPNQFGYYIFISLLFVYIINVILERNKRNIITWIIGIFLILQSASTGMMFGLIAFFAAILAYNLRNIANVTYKQVRKVFYIITSALFGVISVVGISLLILNTNSNKLDTDSQAYPFIDRITGKVSKADGSGRISLWEDRGYDIIYKYPAYLLYGAGEGNYDRYIQATNNHGNEIHATLPSMLFYYGILPFTLLLRWLYSKMRHINPRVFIAYIALLVESFTLLNQRQAIFWMILVIGAAYPVTKVAKKRHARKALPDILRATA